MPSVLLLVHNYLSDKKQQARVIDSYSIRLAVVFWLPQGFILGLPLSNIYITDLFLTLDNTDFVNLVMVKHRISVKNLDEVIETLEKNVKKSSER